MSYPQKYQPHRQFPPSRLELTEEEIGREVGNLNPRQGLNFKQRIIRGLDCCVFILKNLGYAPPQYMDQTYGEEFVEVKGPGGEISVKLIEPRLVCNVNSLRVVIGSEVFVISSRQFLSQYVDTKWVLYFLAPIKDGQPLALPIEQTKTVEKDVVRGFFFCLSNLGFKLNRRALPGTAEHLQSLSQELTDGSQVMDYISTHLLPENTTD